MRVRYLYHIQEGRLRRAWANEHSCKRLYVLYTQSKDVDESSGQNLSL